MLVCKLDHHHDIFFVHHVLTASYVSCNTAKYIVKSNPVIRSTPDIIDIKISGVVKQKINFLYIAAPLILQDQALIGILPPSLSSAF